jgi:hypothetical protein
MCAHYFNDKCWPQLERHMELNPHSIHHLEKFHLILDIVLELSVTRIWWSHFREYLYFAVTRYDTVYTSMWLQCFELIFCLSVQDTQ